MYRFTNYKFEICINDDKFSQTKFENFEPKKLIYHHFKQYDSDQFKLSIFNSMSDMRTHTAFENNFVSILDKHAPKKIYKRIKNPILMKTFRLRQIRLRLKNNSDKSKNLSDIVKFK